MKQFPLKPSSQILNLILAGLSLSVTLLLTELILARFFPQPVLSTLYHNNPNCYQPSSIFPFTLKPNCRTNHASPEFAITIATNSLGFRDTEFSLSKPPGVYRILVVGDSMTFGHGVELEDTFSQILENQLTQSHKLSGPNFEVINAGFAAGFSPDSYYLFLKRNLTILQPDLVVLALFPLNDITDLKHTLWTSVDSRGLPTAIQDKQRHVDKHGFLINNYQPIYYRLKPMANLHSVVLAGKTIESLLQKVNSRINPPAAQPKTALHYYQCLFANDCFEEMETLFTQVNQLILASFELVQQNKSQFLLLLLPADVQVDDTAWEKYAAGRFGLSQPPYPQTRFTNFALDNSIDYLDLLPAFLDHQSQALFFKLDGHFTPLGHQLTADSLFDYLLQQID